MQDGLEPASKGSDFDYYKDSVKAFNWYNYQYNAIDMKPWLIEYMKNRPNVFTKDDIIKYQHIPNSYLVGTQAVIARLAHFNCNVPSDIIDKMHNDVKNLANRYGNKPVVNPLITVNRPVDTSHIIADVDNELDNFYMSDYTSEFNMFEFLKKRGAKQIEAQALIDYYKPIYEFALDDKESNKTPKQRKSHQTFLRNIIQDAELYIKSEQSERRGTRKTKPKSKSKIVSKLNYLNTYNPLKLSSINPTLICDAKELWTYNVKTRRLTYFKTDTAFDVKGTTLCNFNEKESEAKTLRKPADTLEKLLNMGKVTMKATFNKLSTKSTTAVGRINKDTILLKVFK